MKEALIGIGVATLALALIFGSLFGYSRYQAVQKAWAESDRVWAAYRAQNEVYAQQPAGAAPAPVVAYAPERAPVRTARRNDSAFGPVSAPPRRVAPQPSQASQPGFFAKITGTADVVSLDEYMSIRTGMSYDQVCRIIGKQGVENSSNTIPAIPGFTDSIYTVMYSWMNGNRSNTLIMFQNDKMIMKSQFGLQ